MNYYTYTNIGGHAPNCDCAQIVEQDGQVLMVLCDGLNGLPSGDAAAKLISDAAMEALLNGDTPSDVCKSANCKFRELQFDNVDLRRAGSTICVVRIREGHCSWANVGDSHIYHFSNGVLAHHSVDDTHTYKLFERGELDYEAIREQDDRTGLLECIGQKENITPHEEEFDLHEQDALLVCSDGFWEYVYETEMLIDLHKSSSSEDWARKMILRAVQRSHLEGDNMTLITYRKMAG